MPKKGNKNKYIVGLILAGVFFFVMLATLTDYGISWDEPIHFLRGQSYLYYFATGKTQYEVNISPRSYFQTDSNPPDFFLKREGHPPLSDILSAIFNQIFFQRLGVLGDIEAYHLFNITVASLLIFVVAVFAYETYGLFVAVISSLTLSFYPLFFSEAHFNVKDPAETAFFAATIWAFWKSLQRGSARWLFASTIFFSLGLGTKFNVIFIPIILFLYLLIRYRNVLRRGFSYTSLSIKKISKNYLVVIFLSPLIVSTIFFISWPLLWRDTLPNLIKVFNYYKQLGVGHNYEVPFLLPGGFNGFPTYWIVVSTPPIVLALTAVGILSAFFSGRKDKVEILWVLWLLISILRVSIPGTSIYGGVRQIMEYIPAMALLAGLGARFLIGSLKFTTYKYLLFLVTFILLLIPIIKYHPNENVYFNFLVGGLKGAKEKNIPYWGNSYGNAYKPAIDWLNKNTPANAKVALIQGTSLNVPKIMLREDIDFSNQNWSGSGRRGEYLLELTYGEQMRAYPEAWEYVEKFLNPIYEVTVDGVAIAKVWKNDREHTKKEK